MRGILITNAITSALCFIGMATFLYGAFATSSSAVDGIGSVDNEGFLSLNFDGPNKNLIWTWLAGAVIWFLASGVSFIMGIITLAAKGERTDGMIVASGIIGLIGGCIGLNTIVSLIAVKNL